MYVCSYNSFVIRIASRCHSLFSILFSGLLNCVPYVLTCQRAFYVLKYLRTNVSCVLTYSRANVPYVLTCSRALRAYVLACQRALGFYLLTCQLALRGHVSMFLTCLRASLSCVPTCLRALTSNNKNKFSMTCFP